jgi:hypothetical protein
LHILARKAIDSAAERGTDPSTKRSDAGVIGLDTCKLHGA